MMRAWNARALAAMVAAAAVAVYANTLWNGFALDDIAIIQQNTRVHDLANQAAIWLTPYWPAHGPELGLYRPFAIFAYAIEWAAGGGAAWLFHAVNIVLHAGVSVLVFALLALLTPPAAAAAGALVFAVHPVHTEAVANIAGQAELIAAAALLAGVLVAATRPEGARISWPRRVALCTLFMLGALAKESVVVLPGLIVAMDAAQRRIRRGTLRAWAGELTVPIVLLCATFAAVMLLRLEVLGSITGTHAAPGLPFLHGEHRVLVALRALPEVFRLLLFPADLSIDYAPAVIMPVETVTPLVALGGSLLVTIAVLAALTLARPAIGLGAAWFAITIAPISNLFFPIGVVVAERLLYVPSVAVAIVVAFAWRYGNSRALLPVRPALLAFGAVILLMGGRTTLRNPDWKDTHAALAALVRDHPESYRAQISVGNALLASDPEKAREYLEMALRTWPDDPFLRAQIGRLELADGDYVRAIELLERARSLAPFLGETEASLASTYIALDRPADAMKAIDRAHQLGVETTTVLALRGQAYDRMGRPGSAAGAWRAAAHRDTAGVRYWPRLARSLARAGVVDAALAAVDSARPFAPGPEQATLTALEQAIRGGCYATEGTLASTSAVGAGCVDPLAAGAMVLRDQLASTGGAER